MRKAYTIILTLICLLFINQDATSLNSQSNRFLKKEFTQTIQENFQITPDGRVEIDSRYGKLEFVTWEKNEVDLEITIKVAAKNQSAADEVFDRIGIDFSNSRTLVSAETKIAPQKRGWRLWGGGDNHEFEINYLVKMPASVSVDLEHAYGSASVPDLQGNADLSFSYAELQAASFGGNVDLNLRYSEARLGSISQVNADIRYSELKMDNANNLNISSGYSSVFVNATNEVQVESSYDDYDFGQVANLNNNGKYDDFEIEAAANVEAISRYSNYLIGLITQSAKIEMEHGSVKFEEIASDFETIELSGKHTGFQLNMPPQASYTLDIDANYTGVQIPELARTMQLTQEDNDYQLKAVIGSKAEPTSKITLDSRYGYIQIKE